jgi:hypothetical protein
MAALGGVSYKINTNMGNHWLKYLPRNVQPIPSLKNETKFSLECNRFRISLNGDHPSVNWEYPHRYPQAWSAIRDSIITDTRSALQSWASENNGVLPSFDENNVVIENRCAVLVIHSYFMVNMVLSLLVFIEIFPFLPKEYL